MLRIAIGWMFLAGGWDKYHSKKFTSEPFLRGAKGPLASLYQSGLPDVHGFRMHIEEPLQQKPPVISKTLDAKAAAEARTEPYKKWQEQIVQEWGRDLEYIGKHFQFDEKQNEQAKVLLRVYEGDLDNYLDRTANDIAGYRHDLYRMLDKHPQPELPADADMDQRRSAALAVRSWVADERQKYRRELIELATPAQVNSYHEMPAETNTLKSFDQFLIYTHIAIGFCLVAGFLTRLASLGAAAFLVSVVASQPWWVAGAKSWISGPDAVMYQVILMFACLVLMASGAGRWAGLDYFLTNWRQLLSSQKQKEQT